MDSLVSQLRTMFRYDDWANRETLASLERVASPPARALEVMAHIVGCQWLAIRGLTSLRRSAFAGPRKTTSTLC